MHLTELRTDDDAVAPVIGVILMVAITVILAAVIGTFVLGIGSQFQRTIPQAQFTFDEDASNNSVEITHDGGDRVTAANVEVVDSGPNGPHCNRGSADWGATDITAGDSCTTDDLGNTDATLRVTWTSDDGAQSATLARFEYDTT